MKELWRTQYHLGYKDSCIAAENKDIVVQPNDLYCSLPVKLKLKLINEYYCDSCENWPKNMINN